MEIRRFRNDERGNTPLMFAASDRDLEAVKSILDAGADVNQPNNFGETALLRSIGSSTLNPDAAHEVIEYLIDHGADINAQRIDGETILMSAAYRNMIWLVKLLIERGVDVNKRRPDGTTAISSIEAAPSLVRKRKTIIKLLEAAGGMR